MKLTPLPKHLEYAFLSGNQTLLIIITKLFTCVEKDGLHEILSRDKPAFGWTIADINCINPSVVTHHSYTDNDKKLVRQPQHHLNPYIQEVIKKKVIKLLDNRFIYVISDSS